MLLKQRGRDYRDVLRLAWLCLLLGLLASGLTQGRFLAEVLRSPIASERLLNALHGLADGFSVVALGMSIYLNVRGAMLYRQQG